MICEGCGQPIHEGETAEDDDKFRYLVCPNFKSAFQEFLNMEQIHGMGPEQLGAYPCERMYDLPLYYTIV